MHVHSTGFIPPFLLCHTKKKESAMGELQTKIDKIQQRRLPSSTSIAAKSLHTLKNLPRTIQQMTMRIAFRRMQPKFIENEQKEISKTVQDALEKQPSSSEDNQIALSVLHREWANIDTALHTNQELRSQVIETATEIEKSHIETAEELKQLSQQRQSLFDASTAVDKDLKEAKANMEQLKQRQTEESELVPIKDRTPNPKETKPPSTDHPQTDELVRKEKRSLKSRSFITRLWLASSRIPASLRIKVIGKIWEEAYKFILQTIGLVLSHSWIIVSEIGKTVLVLGRNMLIA